MIKETSTTTIEHVLIYITTQLLTETGEPHKRDIRLQDSLQRNLGIDSLGRAELFQRIEKKFSIALPDRLLAEADNLQDILNYIQHAEPRLRATKKHVPHVLQRDHVKLDPSRAETLLDILSLYGENASEKVHIYFQNEDGHEEPITYGQLRQSSLTVAANLKQHGLAEGETVAIMLPTTPLFFYTFLGVLLAGGIPVPIYPPFRAHMIEAYAKTESRMLSNAEVRILVTFDQAEKLSRLLQTFVPSLKVVTTVYELLKSQPPIVPFKAKKDNFALIQYTSGSTNDPKGVLLTHQNLLANIRAYGKAIKASADDVVISWLPLYHDMGLIGSWLGSLYYGAPLILMTPFSFLNHPEKWLWAIHYHRGTISGAPNFAYELCVRKIDPAVLEGLDLSSWRVAANGAEKIYPRTLEEFATKFAAYGFKREAITPMYGLAESTVALAIPPVERGFRLDYVNRLQFEENRLAIPESEHTQALAFVSCGGPIENHEFRIVDDEGSLLPERHVGNLQFRGPSSMQGYYRNQTATEAIYHQGWLDSGDLAYQAEGELYVTGRRKDLIIKAGRNLYPAEIEELVGDVPGIRQGCVAAFGINDTARGTEQLIIVAETRENDPERRVSLTQIVNEAVVAALDIVPDKVILVAPHTVPKTSSGKLQRAACKKLYLDQRLGKWKVPAWLQVVKLSSQMVCNKLKEWSKRLIKCIYTIYVACVVLITLLPVYVLVRFSSSARAARICQKWSRFLIAATLCRMKVVGQKYLTTDSPMIYVSNHASYVDAIVTLACVPAGTRFIGKRELLSAPIIQTFMRKLNCLVVDRTDLSQGIEDTKQIAEVLKEGHSIIIFPEGTFSYSSGLRPFRLGAFKIAAETNIPICPIALKGTRGILRDDEKLMWPGAITVTMGEPIQPFGTEWQEVSRLRQEVRNEIAKYCGEESLNFIAAQTVASKR